MRGLQLQGDLKALRVALGPVRVEGVSREADVRCDTGETYHAYQVGGMVLYLHVPALIEIVHPNLIGVIETPA